MRVLLLLMLLLGLTACGKRRGADEPIEEPSAGGEIVVPAAPYEGPERPEELGDEGKDGTGEGSDVVPAPDPDESSEEDEDEEEIDENPWGATREEQCARTPWPELRESTKRHINEAVDYARRGAHDEARSALQDALRDDPRAYPALYNLGVISEREGRRAEAMEYYRRALAIVSDYTPAVRGLALAHLAQGALPDAYALVDHLAREHRTNLELQALFVELLTRNKRYDDAWSVARRALECDERHVPTLKALMELSFAQKREELGESILRQVLEIAPNDAELRFAYGEFLEKQPGRTREAIAEFRRAVELRPDYAEARVALGRQELGAGNYNDAIEHLRVADRVLPSSTPVRLILADAYRGAGRWEEAKSILDGLLASNPNLAEAHFNLGLMYQAPNFKLGDLDELAILNLARKAFTTYRDLMGSRIARDDPSAEYLAALGRRIQRIEDARRREEEEARRREAGEDAEEEEDEDEIFFFD
ncbi:MAG: tetratricopeptide repeat protein [Sandaracinaceae bacterium]|nr:tetratricopeptide repeat protein [Sandaracinaceae bacterium]